MSSVSGKSARYCHTPSNYVCDSRKFAPRESIGNKSIHEEVISGELGRVSFEVETHSYDTRAALVSQADLNKPEFQPGGEYHRNEYRCFLRNEKGEKILETQTDSDSLKGSLDSAVNRCQKLATEEVSK